jgi:integrase
MAIRKRKGRAAAFEVYWINPFTKQRESQSFNTQEEAKKADSLIKHRLKFDKESFRPPDEVSRTGGTVREICALYLNAKQFTPKNMQHTIEHLRSILEVFGRREIAGLEKKDLVKFITDSQAKGTKITTASRRLTIMRAAISWAAETGLIPSNPLLGVKLPQGQHEVIAPPTLAEAEAILGAARGHIYRAIMMAVFLGVRVGPSELFRLKWSDVDFERAVIRVWSAAKNPKRPYRDIPIRAGLLEEMKGWHLEDREKERGDFIITYKGQPIKSMKRGWHDALKRAGITRRIRPYDLRHAFATYALDQTADIKAVAEIMGHSNPNMILSHYQHTREETRRAVVEAMPDLKIMRPKNEANEKRN